MWPFKFRQIIWQNLNGHALIEHLLFEGQCTQSIWQRLAGLINQLTKLHINSTKINTLFGIPLENNVPVTQAINTCLVIARQYSVVCQARPALVKQVQCRSVFF